MWSTRLLALAFLACAYATVAFSQCIVTLPADPLSAQGLATPFNVTGCDQTKPGEESFVEGAIYDPATNRISIYSPLLVNEGAQPAVAPTPPALPANAVVALWFGSNADALVLAGPGVRAAGCVNGLGASIFGQVAFCNAEAFFKAAKGVPVPPLGVGLDGRPCLTTRDFGLVDMDPSDNVVTTYLVAAGGRLAQNTAVNRARLPGARVIKNGSDNRLLVSLNRLLNCTSFTAPDLADGGAPIGAQALNELMANRRQRPPVALIPLGDPMVLLDGAESSEKLAAYRRGVFQNPYAHANTIDFCRNYLAVAPARIEADERWTSNAAPANPAVGNNMHNFLCARFAQAFGPSGLNCTSLLGVPSPVSVDRDASGVAVNCTVTLPRKPLLHRLRGVFSAPLYSPPGPRGSSYSLSP